MIPEKLDIYTQIRNLNTHIIPLPKSSCKMDHGLKFKMQDHKNPSTITKEKIWMAWGSDNILDTSLEM